jgi:hypothetical protein
MKQEFQRIFRKSVIQDGFYGIFGFINYILEKI